tara:strand:+ start:1608 stop:2216 length:609 start_codon:yes stop_codon:yes gene_type:complete
MKIHHAPNSRSTRALWLFNELDIPYEIEIYPLGDKSMRTPEYLKIHPLGRVPALEDGDVTIFESGAIVQYVLSKYGDGKMLPEAGSSDYPTYLQWLHYAEGMIMPQVNIIVVETLFLPEERRNQTNVDRAMKLLTRMLTAVDLHMKDREFLAGEFSGADIMTGHACIVSGRLGADISDKPSVKAYIDRLEARPALQKAWAMK